MNIGVPLVSVEWLEEHIELESLVILDASILKIGSNSIKLESNECIPKSLFFDLESVFSDTSCRFPSTIPTTQCFEDGAQKLGINSDSLIVIYDREGIYSSARAWWLFKLMGFDNVAVLNGGLPKWKNAEYPMEKNHHNTSILGNFKATLQKQLIVDFDAVLKINSKSKTVIIDARSSLRFKGLQAEPREGLRRGAIPNSINIPYTDVLNAHQMRNASHLKSFFKSIIDEDSKLIFSCGSGITACILALAFEIAGYKNYAVYDGSWTEYGTLTAS